MRKNMDVVDFIKLLIQWIVIPVAGFVWVMHRTQQDHATKLAVLKAVHDANKEAHDREFKELRENFKAVFTKLDTIEQALRK
jgi:exosome complex RNA-binding protein Rrp4